MCYNKDMEKFLGWLAQKLKKYLPPEPTPKPKPYTPQTQKDLIGVLKRTPKAVLSDRERDIIAAAMGFSTTKVAEIMLPRTEIAFVKDDEVLGPLTLDRLYKSGYAHFPVINHQNQIIGILHTQALTSLEIRETDRATKFLDPHVYYVRTDYSLEQALAAFLRTNCYFFLVVSPDAKVVGLLTYEMLVNFLLGEDVGDDFNGDAEIAAVVKRQL